MGKVKREYLPMIMAFDTETTSYVTYKEKNKKDGSTETVVDKRYAWMYIADFCEVVGNSYSHKTFRTWEQVKEYLDDLSDVCMKNEYYVIYVHNLSFEFQFMKDWLPMSDVFCRRAHNVLKCTYRHIEFRDSLALANSKLAKLAENEKLDVYKHEGDLDYDLIRTPSTPLTKEEMEYLLADTEVVCAYIKKKIKEYGNFAEIPLTSTGEVRYLFRKELGVNLEKVHDLAVKYSADNMDLQNLLISIYAGAYTHCNYQVLEKVIHNLTCWDFSSDYPYQMVAEKFPTNWFKVNAELLTTGEFFEYLYTEYNPEEYAWAMEVEFEDLEAKHCHSTLSLHKAKAISSNCIVDNGRVNFAHYARYNLNEIDFDVVSKFYTWKKILIKKCYISRKEYLPKELVAVILKLFRDKTRLKGIEEEYENYMRSKGRINGVYGMTVFDILNSGIYFDEVSNREYLKEEKTFSDFRKYVNNPNNYLWYSIGVWVTSYARRMILAPISRLAEDAVYCDTDSVKLKNFKPRYAKLFKVVNNSIMERFNKAMEYHKFSPEEYEFYDKDGVQHFLGVFEEETPYRRFKSLGSKRYLYEVYDKKKGRYVTHSTVAGAPKNMADTLCTLKDGITAKGKCKYFSKGDCICENPCEHKHSPLGETNDEKFANFTNNFCYKNCKLIHFYLEDDCTIPVRDYLGEVDLVHVKSSVCLEKADFSMKLADEFFEFLMERIQFDDVDIYKYFRPNQYNK